MQRLKLTRAERKAQRMVKRISPDTARAAAMAARIVRYCNLCNAETVRPRAWLCSSCGRLLTLHIGHDRVQALHRFVDVSGSDSPNNLEREYINAPIDARLDSLLSDLMADDIRLAVAIAQRRQDVDQYYQSNNGQQPTTKG